MTGNPYDALVKQRQRERFLELCIAAVGFRLSGPWPPKDVAERYEELARLGLKVGRSDEAREQLMEAIPDEETRRVRVSEARQRQIQMKSG